MAAAHVTTRSILSAFLPRLSASTASSFSRNTTLFSRQLSLPLIPSLAFAIPSAIQLNVPGLLEGIWESILRAVPKKKTSHMKKRHRQLAGKALKDVTSLNKCSVCGNVKRAHYLCPFCVAEIQGRDEFGPGRKGKEAREAKAAKEGNEAEKTKADKPADE
ncbi:putative 54S ribosomal protein L32 [Lachnellula suecica]|uniref:Large ribosomal subunit protein bL32m n=1 Tax=Lachnellula suecica TaxID=602035 RepID=A0A8T9CA66_9HELO|nr:putative 54S ribosomal protein L32 [Lachnellula suecica]